MNMANGTVDVPVADESSGSKNVLLLQGLDKNDVRRVIRLALEGQSTTVEVDNSPVKNWQAPAIGKRGKDAGVNVRFLPGAY